MESEERWLLVDSVAKANKPRTDGLIGLPPCNALDLTGITDHLHAPHGPVIHPPLSSLRRQKETARLAGVVELNSSANAMKFLRAIFAGLMTGAAAKAADPTPVKSPAEIMREMRTAWLTKFHEKKETEKPDSVVAVLMDWPLGEQTVTVLASAGGDASLYTTSTFGILGGIGHASVRKAAVEFVGCAQHLLELTAPTTEFPYPDRESIRFYVVTPSGVRTVTFAMKDTEQPQSAARALYAYGQKVVTELRKTIPETR